MIRYFLAIGRRANVESINPQAIKLAYTKQGIITDSYGGAAMSKGFMPLAM
ncbi:MAG: hypothetical protein R2865_07610 [Deinococcales bacterium]